MIHYIKVSQADHQHYRAAIEQPVMDSQSSMVPQQYSHLTIKAPTIIPNSQSNVEIVLTAMITLG